MLVHILHRDIGIGLQVEIPRGRIFLSPIGACNHKIIAMLEKAQWGGALFTCFAPLRKQEQHSGFSHPSAKFAICELIEKNVDTRKHTFQERHYLFLYRSKIEITGIERA